ncbi:fatty acid desaturase [Corallococcus macrosporus]|uniref:Fatty acid desaturase family protein n=1 Tax=Myxococcus fulvus (strain ATCC BAA-855 / HW-1) TaxID=483219 RepID=F8CEX4_MYXFH|nr:fatty acid desaturase [Corallococcus macrosporus]AEI67379.1 fatty acid desaturase family protein [Corallococcus macrosporus]
MSAGEGRDTPIPAALNAVLLVCAMTACASSLWLASHAERFGVKVLAAGVFSFVNNTVFSLLHEATHGVLHPRRRVNDALGRVVAAFFPTSFTMQRAFHLNHHRHNRTHLEQFDYFRPGDNRFLKRAQWYSILSGLYWLFVPVGAVAFALVPGLLHRLRGTGTRYGEQTGADAYLGRLESVPGAAIRAEVVLAACIQAGLAVALELSLVGWCLCYAAFAINWSALQYADHAWSPLHVRDGAWDLRVAAPVRWVFLNYHYHRAHHRHPHVPWLYLGRYVDPDVTRPSFLRIWLSMWRGPRPLPATPEER